MLKEQVFGLFKTKVKADMTTNEICGKLSKSLEDSTRISTQLKDSKRSREKCRNNAVWIGVMRYDISDICC